MGCTWPPRGGWGGADPSLRVKDKNFRVFVSLSTNLYNYVYPGKKDIDHG